MFKRQDPERALHCMPMNYMFSLSLSLHGYHRMPSGELMSNHVKHYQPADPRRRAQVGDGWLGSAGDAAAGAATVVGGLAGLSAATGIGVPAAVAEGTLAAGLGATGALLHGADTLLSGGGDCGCDEQHGDGARCTATTSKGTRCPHTHTHSHTHSLSLYLVEAFLRVGNRQTQH